LNNSFYEVNIKHDKQVLNYINLKKRKDKKSRTELPNPEWSVTTEAQSRFKSRLPAYAFNKLKASSDKHNPFSLAAFRYLRHLEK